MGVLSADRTEVLQETLPLHHASITQLPPGPRVPRERSTGPGPGGFWDGQQEHGPGAALGSGVHGEHAVSAPASACTAGRRALPAPGGSGTARNHRPPLPAGSNAPRLALVWFLRGASTCENRLRANWGETTSAKASFRSRERKERAGRESELEPGAESYSPRAGARQRSWRSREGAIHKPPTVSGRAGQAAGPSPGRDGMGWDGSRGPWWGAAGCPLGAVPGHQLYVVEGSTLWRTRAAGDAYG